jgi:hypothetical protein
MQTSVQVITTSSHALHNSLSKTSYINLTSREFTCSTSPHHHLYAFLKLRNQTTFCCHIPQTSQSLVLAQLCRPKLKGFYHLHNIRARYTLPVEQQTNHVNLSNIPSDGSHSNTIQSYQLRKAGLHATTPSLHQSSPHAFQPPPKAIQTRTTPIESPPPPLYPSLPIHIAPAQPSLRAPTNRADLVVVGAPSCTSSPAARSPKTCANRHSSGCFCVCAAAWPPSEAWGSMAVPSVRSVTRSRSGGTASGAPRIGDGEEKAPGE